MSPEKLCDYFLNETKLCPKVCLILVPNEKINQQIKCALKCALRNVKVQRSNRKYQLFDPSLNDDSAACLILVPNELIDR